MATKLIADISHHVPVTNWIKFKSAVSFAICKATESTTFVDPTVKSFIANCEKYKIHYWLYCYLRKGNELKQTQFMVDTCKPLVGKYFVGYALDFEKSNTTTDILKCIDYITGLKKKCLVYGKCAITAVKKRYSDNVGYWYARYKKSSILGKNVGTYNPDFKPKSAYINYVDLYQYTDNGECPGLKRNGDMNVVYGKKSLNWFLDPTFVETSVVTSTQATKTTYPGTWPTLPKTGSFKIGVVSNEVCKLKEFLNWYGNYKLTITNKNYKENTAAAVKDFQRKEGLTVDGIFGSKSLAQAKKVKR